MAMLPQSVKVLMARSYADAVSGVAEVKIKIPASRTLSGGFGKFKNQADGDYVKIVVRDDDNVLGYGANFIVSSFSDTDEPAACQGWYFMGDETMQIKPMIQDDPTDLSAVANCYLVLTGYKADTEAADTLYCNFLWGKRIR